MAKTLVIVESPAKARTLNRFLSGQNVEVLASMGHIRDLPTNALGVDIDKNFAPSYVITANGKKTVSSLKKAAGKAEQVYLATDPDREGEAISWHLYELLKDSTKAEFHRVTFHEITKSAINHAFQQPSELEMHKVDAQQARRVLDRIVGYKVSPLLWRNIKKGASAGRVQSVALRLVCERDREIAAFEPVEYWNMGALFQPHQDPTKEFEGKLAKLDGKKPVIPNGDVANALAEELEKAAYQVAAVNRKPKQRRAAPPFITSTMQQAAASLRFSTQMTMRVAQELYEGIDIGAEGAAGLITYMRTDSVAVAKEAQETARTFIGETYGPDYVPGKANVYRSRQTAQGAHEAIRPTDVNRTPEKMARYLSPQQLKLYRLVWNRFVASQMAPAKTLEHSIEVEALGDHLTHSYLFRSTVTTVTFPGYLKVYNVKEADEEEEKNDLKELPELKQGEGCNLKELSKTQHFTEPPKHYSEATLVKALEQNGVGRPSTYSSIVNTIQQRNYVIKETGRLKATELGFNVNDYLVGNMDALFEVKFTARMEEELDEIESGKMTWTDMLGDFYGKFSEWVKDVISGDVPPAEQIREYLELFKKHENEIEWAAPVKRGRRTYDDRKFLESIEKQLDEGKDLSDRQWYAILGVTAKYADSLPELNALAKKTGNEKGIAELKAKFEQERAALASDKPINPAQAEMVEALEKVDFQPPVKRGKRTYDDKKFYTSLKEQVDQKRELSAAQEKALKVMLSKYATQIPTFAELSEKHNIAKPEVQTPEQLEKLRRTVALFDKIEKWNEPTKRGRRVYDDKEFAESIRSQLSEKQQLSDRQIAAAKKMLAKYHEQIPEYKSLIKELDLTDPEAGKKPVKGVQCPECGQPILERMARGRKFYGCSGYPKCKYTARNLDDIPKK